MPVALPPTWTRSEEEIFCLTCSRALAADAAMQSAPADCSREDRLRIRRRGMVEFELGRSPGAADRTIALACHTSAGAVAAIRAAALEAPTEAPTGLPEHRDSGSG